MSSIYRKVEIGLWGDEKFRSLSPLAPSGQSLWLYLLTGPHTGIMPGLSQIGRAALAESLDWEIEAFEKAFQEVLREGLAQADFKARVIWLPNAIKYNPPASPNVVIAWGKHFNLIPDCEIKRRAYDQAKSTIYEMTEQYGKAFDKAFKKPSFKTSINQKQKQELDQEQSIHPREESLQDIHISESAGLAIIDGGRSASAPAQELPSLDGACTNSARETRADPAAPMLLPGGADEIEDRILERAGLCADSVPPIYADAWALLNCQKPGQISEAEWRQALDDGGRFLDRWAAVAEQRGWTAGEIFDVPRAGRAGGLIWRLRDRRVVAHEPDYVRLVDESVVMREQIDVGAWHPRPLDVVVEGVR